MTTSVARYTRRILIGLAVLLALLGTIAVTATVYLNHQLGEIERIDGVFDQIGPRPTRPTEGTAADALNILLLGTDRRSDDATSATDAEPSTSAPGTQRSDSMMLVHVDADRRGITIVSLPRDSWVAVPGHGRDRINTAYAYGGASLAVQTVERLTEVRIDHLAVIDWEGFRELTDAVGGITVTIPETVYDAARGITWTAGQHTLDGEQALDYISQRHGLPRGDLDRVQRQQAVLGTLAEETLALRSSPHLVIDFVDMVARHLSVDAEWSTGDMRSLALSLRRIGADDVRYLTAPVNRLDQEDGESVVRLDPVRGASLWQAVREDRIDSWADGGGSAEANP